MGFADITQGKRAGSLIKLRERGFRTRALPTIYLANFRSLANKMNELLFLKRANMNFCKSVALCFTKTCLVEHIPDNLLHLLSPQSRPHNGARLGTTDKVFLPVQEQRQNNSLWCGLCNFADYLHAQKSYIRHKKTNITLQQCTREYMEVLTVVVSDDIGNINLAIWGFRPHTIMQDTGFGIPQGMKMRHGNAAIYLNTVSVMACRECVKKKYNKVSQKSQVTLFLYADY